VKIIFDHQIFGWQKYGGISRYAFELAKHLAVTLGQDVQVVCPLYINEYLKQAPEKLIVRGRPAPAFPHCGRIYRAVNAILARPGYFFSNPDIVHETYFAGSSVAPKHAKKVLTVYDMIHERFPEDFSAWNPTRKEKAIAVKRADHVICISGQTRDDLIQYLGVAPQKISVVHLGFSMTLDEPVKELSFNHEGPYLLYVGQRNRYKNFQGLARAYASSIVLKMNFRICCFGGGPFTSTEQALFAELGIDRNRIRQISGDDRLLQSLYQQAVAFIYPSLYEGFGIPPLEAMRFKCPVACSAASSIPEVVGDAACFFDPRSVDSIRDALEAIVQDTELRNRLIGKGLERIKRFSWENCAAETLQIYKRLTS